MKKLIMALMLMPMMALATTWYVNGSTGSDYNSGTSASSAKATIQAAVDAAAAGDTIIVAAGTYGLFASNNKRIIIKSVGGAQETIIDGLGVYNSESTILWLSEDFDSDSRPAITNTVLEGFTVKGLSHVHGGTLKSCVIRDNDTWSLGGAAFYYGIAENCLFLNNRGMNGAAADGCVLRNCTMVGNSARDINGVCMNSILENCIVYGNGNDERSTWQYWFDRNPLVTSSDHREENVYVGDPGFVDAANGDYRLAAGSPCIDAGDNSYVTTTTDLAGNARIANGTVDIGCYEYGATTEPTGNNGLSISYYDAGNLATLRSFNMESATYEDAINFFAKRTPSLVTNTSDIGTSLDFGGTLATCRFHGKYIDFATEYFWAFMKGNITLLESGLYEFGFDCDDSCVIYIDGQKVVGSSNNYDSYWFCQEYASIWLTAGNHEIVIVYGENITDQGLTVYMKRPSESSASPLPQSILYSGEAVAPVLHTVTFDLNGADGAAPAERQVAEGAAVGELPTVSRTGYTLLGWYTAASDGTQITASTMVTGDVTCYAQWRINRYTATFDANGGEGGTAMTQDYGTALTSPTVTRTGYTFTGWSPSVPSTMPTENRTYTAQWRINQYTATFDANGGVGGRVVTQDYGTALTAPTVTRTGYTFTGWSPEVAATVPASDVTYIAQWLVNSYAMTFDANGGTGSTTMTQDYGTALTAPTVTRTGYTFTGWSPAVPSTVPAADATYAAQWRINSYTVTFDAQGGAGGGTVARNHGAALGELPVPTRDGFSFDGWFTAASGGTEVSSATVITGAVTFYAHWTEQSLYQTPVWYDEDGEEIDWTRYYDGDEEPFAAESAATFDGYVLDGEEVCGLVQVKVGKANKKTETSKVSASLTLLGEAKKRSYKGTMSKRGVAELTCNGRGNLSLCLGTNAMWGEVDGLSVNGSRNVFAKAGDPKAAALARWQGTYALVLETVDAEGAGSAFAWGYSGLTVEVGAKGKVKVQGTMVDGSKVNVTSQLLVGEKRSCIPVVVPLYSKQGGFGFNLWLQEDGTVEAGEMGAWDATASKTPFLAWFGEIVPTARAGAALPGTLSFLFMGEPDLAEMEVLYDFVPWEVSITTGTKWTLPAAGSVKYDREAEEYVDAKDSSNPAGLKLTYVAKTGAFKGSFKLYATDSAGRLKKLTANVSGVMVGRQGYGTATVKGIGSWPVAIE